MHGQPKMRNLRVTIKDDATGKTLMAFKVSPVRKKKRRSPKPKTRTRRTASRNGHSPEAALGGLTFTE